MGLSMDPLAVAGEQASLRPRVQPPKRSFWWKFRISAVLRFARLMRVPIDVHGSYFNDGRYENKANTAPRFVNSVKPINASAYNAFMQDVRDDLIHRPRPVDGGTPGPEAA